MRKVLGILFFYILLAVLLLPLAVTLLLVALEWVSLLQVFSSEE